MNFVDQLLASKEPSIHLQLRLGVEGATEAQVTDLREQVRRSARAAALLSERNQDAQSMAIRTASGQAPTGCW